MRLSHDTKFQTGGPYIPSYLFKRLRELIDIDIPDPSFSHPESRTSMIRLFVSNAHDRATYLPTPCPPLCFVIDLTDVVTWAVEEKHIRVFLRKRPTYVPSLYYPGNCKVVTTRERVMLSSIFLTYLTFSICQFKLPRYLR